MNKEVTAVIPVRKGSQRVPKKNIKSFGDTNLLTLKISQLKRIKNLHKIIVNSDCEEMLAIADQLGVHTQKRDDYYCSSFVNNSEYFEHIGQVTQAEHIMYAPVTCPFVKDDTIEKCIDIYQDLEDFDSVMTAFDVKNHLWLDGKPINYEPKNAPNSQDLPEILAVHYGVSILSKETMIKNRNAIGERPFFIKLGEEEAFDIDTELEFEFAEFLYKKNT